MFLQNVEYLVRFQLNLNKSVNKIFIFCLQFPSSSADWDNSADEFHSRWNFPLCMGALDGKHVAFRARKEDGAFYRNYKGFNSIVLLALVDANCRFLYINVGCNGRISDGGVLRESNLTQLIEEAAQNFSLEKTIGNGRTLPYVIVADSAFPLRKNIMKPYPHRSLEEPKRVFNARLSRARHTVEHAFGILASRFRVLPTTINLGSHKVDSIVQACCALHNFLYDMKETEMNVASTSTNAPSLISGATNDMDQENSATEKRDEFTNYFNNEGKLSWMQV